MISATVQSDLGLGRPAVPRTFAGVRIYTQFRLREKEVLYDGTQTPNPRFGLITGNALVSINVVILRQARLVPGWVTRLKTFKPARRGISHPSRLLSLNLPFVGRRNEYPAKAVSLWSKQAHRLIH